jgi:hypothetical protein
VSRQTGNVERQATTGAAPPPAPASAPATAGRWWCEHCGHEVPESEATVMRSGRLRCVVCKRRLVSLDTAAAIGAPGAAAAAGEEEDVRAPWHFKLLAIGTVGYLIYRLIWFIFWLTGHGWHG